MIWSIHEFINDNLVGVLQDKEKDASLNCLPYAHGGAQVFLQSWSYDTMVLAVSLLCLLAENIQQ